MQLEILWLAVYDFQSPLIYWKKRDFIYRTNYSVNDQGSEEYYKSSGDPKSPQSPPPPGNRCSGLYWTHKLAVRVYSEFILNSASHCCCLHSPQELAVGAYTELKNRRWGLYWPQKPAVVAHIDLKTSPLFLFLFLLNSRTGRWGLYSTQKGRKHGALRPQTPFRLIRDEGVGCREFYM